MIVPRLARLIRSPLFRRANYFATAVQAAGVGRRVYRNYKRKRAASSYVEQRFTKKARKTPTAPRHKVPKKMALAPSVTKIKATTKVKTAKVPKSVSCHYKDFGLYTANKCMYINHEHWGSNERFWYTIALGLTKVMLNRAGMYAGKTLSDPVIGPATNPLLPVQCYADLLATDYCDLKMVFAHKDVANDGDLTYSEIVIGTVLDGFSPDRYKSFEQIAKEVKDWLIFKYCEPHNGVYTTTTWLHGIQSVSSGTTAAINNSSKRYTLLTLDDAVINVRVNSLLKYQNVTPSDNASLDKTQLDTNPLKGRIYMGKGCTPNIDTNLNDVEGIKDLDTFFGSSVVQAVAPNTETNYGLRLCHSSTGVINAASLGHIVHIPQAKALYGNQSVSTGLINNFKPGDIKYHKTSFAMKRTFKDLAYVATRSRPPPVNEGLTNTVREDFGKHTLIGLTMVHRHGSDTINVGVHREVEASCFITVPSRIQPIKMNYTNDFGAVESVGTVPTDHQMPTSYAPGAETYPPQP